MTMLATLPVNHTNHTMGLTSESAAKRSCNQLLSVIVGRNAARDTDHLKDEPSKRVQACLALATAELNQAIQKLSTDPDANRLVKQCQRKMDSLASLQVFSNLINETEW
jgi:hypothetical protein